MDHLYHAPHEQGVRFFMHYGDLTDATNLVRIIQETQPAPIEDAGPVPSTRALSSTSARTAQPRGNDRMEVRDPIAQVNPVLPIHSKPAGPGSHQGRMDSRRHIKPSQEREAERRKNQALDMGGGCA
ncbi:MAG: hypothetical protein ACYC5Q_16725 [Thermoleophilia bacterium]